MVIIIFNQPTFEKGCAKKGRGFKGGDSPLSPLANNFYYYIRNGQCNTKYTIANTNHSIFVYSRLYGITIEYLRLCLRVWFYVCNAVYSA